MIWMKITFHREFLLLLSFGKVRAATFIRLEKCSMIKLFGWKNVINDCLFAWKNVFLRRNKNDRLC